MFAYVVYIIYFYCINIFKMMVKTTTISARVPVDIANALKYTCKKRGINMSKYLTEIVTTPRSDANIGSEIEFPSDLKPVLAVLGGGGIGLLVYKLLKTYMPTENHTEETIENTAILCAMAAGLGSAIAIDKLISNED
jgi:hypothetical protein